KWLNLAILFSLTLHLILLFTPLSTLFGVVAITSIKEWIIIISLSLSGLLVFEFGKLIKKRINKI
ncbi:MAG: cation transporting ATPase C-terminal domain-containing protein, partial [Nanoarchaeota archaeon]